MVQNHFGPIEGQGINVLQNFEENSDQYSLNYARIPIIAFNYTYIPAYLILLPAQMSDLWIKTRNCGKIKQFQPGNISYSMSYIRYGK